MKCLTLYLHASSEGAVLDCLRAHPRVSGFTLVACQGHSNSDSVGQAETTMDHVVGFVPRIRIEVVLEDGQAQEVLASLKEHMGGRGSHGMWTITPVQEWGSI